MISTITFRDWIFEVDRQITVSTYKEVAGSGAETCSCDDCKNYVAHRDDVFPPEIIGLFTLLGVDYRKEVEVTTWEELPDGRRHIGGWFHFKGRIVKGKKFRNALGKDSYTYDLTPIHENFSIGFAEGNSLTFFTDHSDLVQIEFDTIIPWVIN